MKQKKMNLEQRIDIMVQLGEYMLSDNEQWTETKEKAFVHNGWFLPDFIDLSVNNIVHNFLQKNVLQKWVQSYSFLSNESKTPKQVGLVMAGNIPLVGFHDFLCVFLSGHYCLIKPSSKDEILITHLVNKLWEWAPQLQANINFSTLLKNCDAYIATGSNSTAGYFEYYFAKFPHIIRRNRTSVAVLNGNESKEELEALADDIYLYFGMGCRNVTKIFVPQHYPFEPLLQILKKYNYLSDHHKYKNNYDYNLALHLLNNKVYMSNASLILVEETSMFSPISQLNYEVYDDIDNLKTRLEANENVQCIVGSNFIPFGKAQQPSLIDYADGIDTMQWLSRLS